jgi:predicted secreted protein
MVNVVLEENPTTGFRWSVVQSGAPVCRLAKESFEAGDRATPGAGGQRRWVFQADAFGEGKILLEDRRHWEDRPSRSFSLTVEVDRQ